MSVQKLYRFRYQQKLTEIQFHFVTSPQRDQLGNSVPEPSISLGNPQSTFYREVAQKLWVYRPSISRDILFQGERFYEYI